MFLAPALPTQSTEFDEGQRIEIAGKETRCLDRDARILRIIDGCAWVTIDGADLILKAGERLKLMPGAGEAVISPLGQRILIYEITRR